MFKPQCHRILVALIAIFAMSVAFAEQAASISEAIGNGKGKLSFRYRDENVEQDGFRRDADASTLQTMPRYKPRPVRGCAAGACPGPGACEWAAGGSGTGA